METQKENQVLLEAGENLLNQILGRSTEEESGEKIFLNQEESAYILVKKSGLKGYQRITMFANGKAVSATTTNKSIEEIRESAADLWH